jgi:hypothetical protein
LSDGTLGVLQSSDILSYNLQLTDNFRPAYDVDLTPANSGIVADTGWGLSPALSPKVAGLPLETARAEFLIFRPATSAQGPIRPVR